MAKKATVAERSILRVFKKYGIALVVEDLRGGDSPISDVAAAHNAALRRAFKDGQDAEGFRVLGDWQMGARLAAKYGL